MNVIGPAALPAAVPAAQWDALREPAVRDLAWLLFSADLLRARPPVGIVRAHSKRRTSLPRPSRGGTLSMPTRQALQRDIAAARVTRLGHYAECLLAWFLQHGPAARLIAADLPLRRAGLTLGECDFRCRRKPGGVCTGKWLSSATCTRGTRRVQLAD